MKSKSFSLVLLLTFSSVTTLPTLLSAQTTVEATVLLSEAQRQVAAALAASNATLEAVRRQSDRELRLRLFEIEELQDQIEELVQSSDSAQGEVASLRDELALEQKRFVETLANIDRAYAKEIAAYRAALEDIASTPQGLAALERFNAGEEAEALAILDQLRSARDLAAARRIAQLALDAWGRGRINIESVLARYSEITQLDPNAFWDWIQLSRIQSSVGDLTDAEQSALFAAEISASEFEESAAAERLGDVLLSKLEFMAALEAYEASLEILKEIIIDDPKNGTVATAIAVLFRKTGDIRFHKLSDVEAAASDYYRSMRVVGALLKDDPDNAVARLNFAQTLIDFGNVQSQQGAHDRALKTYSLSLKHSEQLVAADPENVNLQSNLSFVLRRIGDVQHELGDLTSSISSYKRSLVIAEFIAAADPGNSDLKQSLAAILREMAAVFTDQGELELALDAETRNLEIVDALAAANPGNIELHRNTYIARVLLGFTTQRLGNTKDARFLLEEALRINTGLAERFPNGTWEKDRVLLQRGLDTLE